MHSVAAGAAEIHCERIRRYTDMKTRVGVASLKESRNATVPQF